MIRLGREQVLSISGIDGRPSKHLPPHSRRRDAFKVRDYSKSLCIQDQATEVESIERARTHESSTAKHQKRSRKPAHPADPRRRDAETILERAEIRTRNTTAEPPPAKDISPARRTLVSLVNYRSPWRGSRCRRMRSVARRRRPTSSAAYVKLITRLRTFAHTFPGGGHPSIRGHAIVRCHPHSRLPSRDTTRERDHK